MHDSLFRLVPRHVTTCFNYQNNFLFRNIYEGYIPVSHILDIGRVPVDVSISCS